MTSLSHLRSDFSEFPAFFDANFGVNYAVTGGQGRVGTVASTPTGFMTSVAYDVTGSSVSIEVVEVPSPAGAICHLSLWIDSSNYIRIGYYQDKDGVLGHMWMGRNRAGAQTWHDMGPYDPVEHRWWRIRHSIATNRVYLQFGRTSNGRVQWHVARSFLITALPTWDITAMQVRIGTTATANGADFVIDNLNITPPLWTEGTTPRDYSPRHTVAIYDRGGQVRIGQFQSVISVEWNRVRDDISTAKVVVPQGAPLLDLIATARHELVIYRGSDRVWEGPIIRTTRYSDRVEIEARDVMYYVYRTAMTQPYDNSYPNSTTCIDRSMTILTAELARKEALDPPINVLPHVVPLVSADDSRTSRKTTAYETDVWSHIDDMAYRSGMDYFVLGRSIFLTDTHTVVGRTRPVSENDFLGDVIVSEYGADAATLSVVTGAEGAYGLAGGTPDDYYGIWEIVRSAYDENSASAPTQAELNGQAQRNLAGRLPPPVEVRVPDNSSVNPDGVLTIDVLVPCVRIPLVATLSGRELSQMQKLDSVRVREDRKGEVVTVVMSPASLSDQDPEEGSGS